MVYKTLCVFGTRPEAIKMAPVVKALSAVDNLQNKVCVTGQHREMLDGVLQLFGITPDFNLEVMAKDQDLSSLTAKILKRLPAIYREYQPNLVLVHGDTTTTFAASLAAYYYHIPVAHVEAGLRTWDINSPWPEEANRKLTSALAKLHFAPTSLAKNNLLKEGIREETIYVTGNTVVDALFEMSLKLESDTKLVDEIKSTFPFLNSNRRMILVTGHRRESFGKGFEQICQALLMVAKLYPDVDIVYPVHLNPSVQGPVNTLLAGIQNIHLIPPVDYLQFIYLMKSSYLILTDSGGVQEEAPSLGKPVLLMRNITERPEALNAGTLKLVGTKAESIVDSVVQLLRDKQGYQRMQEAVNPYGDGKASLRIAHIISQLSNTSFEALSLFNIKNKEGATV